MPDATNADGLRHDKRVFHGRSGISLRRLQAKRDRAREGPYGAAELYAGQERRGQGGTKFLRALKSGVKNSVAVHTTCSPRGFLERGGWIMVIRTRKLAGRCPRPQGGLPRSKKNQ